jgi:hypothetical protein
MAIKHRVRGESLGAPTKVLTLTARKAIQQFCRECVGFNIQEVKRCTDVQCPLWPFRLHTTPKGVV